MNRRLRLQAGLTLIEAMIAMTLGLLLIAGVVQIFMSGRESYRVQEGLGRVQENGRFADFFVSRTLRQAGIPRTTNAPFFRPIDNRLDPAGAALTRDGDPGGTGPDTITVMYRSNTNCLGNGTNYGAQEIRDVEGNLYARDQFTLNNENPRSLVCRGLGADGLPVVGHTQPIVQGVDDFQVLYGVDTDGDGSPNRFDNATGITPLEWGAISPTPQQIVSLRFALLMNSDQTSKTIAEKDELKDKTLYAVLDSPLRGPYNDGRIRRVFRSTIELRNRTP